MESGLVSFLPATAAHFYYPSLTTKCLPIWLLAVRTFVIAPDRTISYGLAVSSIGDACLYLHDGHDGDLKEAYFLVGLLCFLLAHILYTKAFLLHTSYHTRVLCVPLFVYYMAMMALILPDAPTSLHYPIMFYGLAISLMGYACLNFFVNVVDPVWKSNARAGMIGAVFFIVSDSVLAIAKFSRQYRGYFKGYHSEIVMVTYYIGQFLIAKSSMLDGAIAPKKKE